MPLTVKTGAMKVKDPSSGNYVDVDMSLGVDYAPINSPEFAGTPKAPTATSETNNTQIATTAFVQGLVSTEASARQSADSALQGSLNTLETNVGGTVAIGTEAGLIRKSCFFDTTANIPLGSTGVTLEAYARGAIFSNNGKTGSIVAVGYSGRIYSAFFSDGAIVRAQIIQSVSPAFTGTPTAPTAEDGTNTTQIATTAFVDSATANVAINKLYELSDATLYNITGTVVQNLKGKVTGDIMVIGGRIRVTVATRTGSNGGVMYTIPNGKKLDGSINAMMGMSAYSDGIRNGEATLITGVDSSTYFNVMASESYANILPNKDLIFYVPPMAIKLK